MDLGEGEWRFRRVDRRGEKAELGAWIGGRENADLGGWIGGGGNARPVLRRTHRY